MTREEKERQIIELGDEILQRFPPYLRGWASYLYRQDQNFRKIIEASIPSSELEPNNFQKVLDYVEVTVEQRMTDVIGLLEITEGERKKLVNYLIYLKPELSSIALLYINGVSYKEMEQEVENLKHKLAEVELTSQDYLKMLTFEQLQNAARTLAQTLNEEAKNLDDVWSNPQAVYVKQCFKNLQPRDQTRIIEELTRIGSRDSASHYQKGYRLLARFLRAP